MGSAYPTIAADVLAKYYRLNGKETVFVTGSDEHGEKIATTAANVDKKPQVRRAFVLLKVFFVGARCTRTQHNALACRKYRSLLTVSCKNSRACGRSLGYR